jgi:biotin carboxyl carrier protein
MTTLDLDVGGVVRHVQVMREGRRLVVEVDGRRHVLDATATEPGRWSLLFDERHASHEVLVRNGQPGAWVVHVDGAVVPVRLLDPRRRDPSSTDGRADGLVRIVAPMPGKIVKVLVQSGAAVSARQPLIVIEAMKMENELRAPRTATVTDVLVSEGALVEAGALLVTMA